jgi:hypothetical protein
MRLQRRQTRFEELPASEVCSFSLEDVKQHRSERLFTRKYAGRLPLADDNAARAFGKAMIRDMMRDDTTRYAGWTMDVAKGARPVCSIPFPSERIPPSALILRGPEVCLEYFGDQAARRSHRRG